MQLYQNAEILKLELVRNENPVLEDGTYKGEYGSNIISFRDNKDNTWKVTIPDGVRGFGYPAIVHVKDGRIDYVAV